MSDYMFVLDSHLSSEQARAVNLVREATEEANLTLFLTGAAMRDMMGGFPIRELDFTVEGPALKLAKSLAGKAGVELIETDDLRKSAYFLFPGDVPVHISMARREKYGKPGAKPSVQPALIHEDLSCRDITVNAIALSLSKASRGLLLDPTNGLGDLDRKELRAVSNYSLYDDPARIFRLIRLRVRLGFTIDERTWNQYKNVREANLESKIPVPALARELRQIGSETAAGDILKALDEEQLLAVFSPALTGAKLNLPGFAKLQKAQMSVPFGVTFHADHFSSFLATLVEKLSSRERSQFLAQSGLDKSDLDTAVKLESRATKFEKELAAAKFSRPSAAYAFMSKAPGEVLLYILAHSNQRTILDRLRNYFGKYLQTAQEVTEEEVVEAGGKPGTPSFAKIQAKLITARLDARPKKVVVEEPPPPPPPPAPGRRPASNSSFGR